MITFLILAAPLYLWWEWRRFMVNQKMADDLLRFEIRWHEARRCLDEFPDAVDALEYVWGAISPEKIHILRSDMRQRRDTSK